MKTIKILKLMRSYYSGVASGLELIYEWIYEAFKDPGVTIN
jgi:hypothetical protein